MLILAVDDETLMLNMLVETLKNVFSDERYVVMGFDDGKQALEYVSSSEESLPYAFLDIRLRGMLGIELAKEIKEIRSETRIIFCSAYTEYALDAFSPCRWISAQTDHQGKDSGDPRSNRYDAEPRPGAGTPEAGGSDIWTF